jgi:hypothetical protein
MRQTGYDRAEELAGRATGYLAGKAGAYEPIPSQDARGAYAAGGLYSTIEDMVRFEQGLVSGKLLPRKALDQASTPGMLEDGRRTAYGYGWITMTYRGLREVGHGGDITGFNTYIARYPDEKFTVIVLSNVGMRPPGPLPDAGDLVHRIAAIWLAGRMQNPEARPDVRVAPATLDLYVGVQVDAPEADPANGRVHRGYPRSRPPDRRGQCNGAASMRNESVFQAQGSPAELTTCARDGARYPSSDHADGPARLHALRAAP